MSLGRKGAYALAACVAVPIAAAAVFAATESEGAPAPIAATVATPQPDAQPAELPQAGYVVYLDENGKRVSKPDNVPAPQAPAADLSKATKVKRDVEGGGWMLDTRNVKVYATAEISPEGKIHTNCETHLGEADHAGEK